ncbi:hypothetical protein K2P96_02135 [Patescibacteria group bacterium]|nr:hypothetical protein [Patescibacteria group bacterium]
MCIKADPERDARFFGPLRELGVSDSEFSIGVGYHQNKYSLSETMLVGNPLLREIRSITLWEEALTILQKTVPGSPERIWAVAKCADVFDWNS